MADLKTVRAREALKPRKAPYWHPLGNGRAVGFLKLTADRPGSWQAQWYDEATRKQARKSLGTFDGLPPAERFDAARKAVEARCEHLDRGGSTEARTIGQACAEYVEHLRQSKGPAQARDAEGRFKRWVSGAPLERITLDKLSKTHVLAWRRALEGATVALGPGRTKGAGSPRSKASLNRDMSALRAALNLAKDRDHVTTDHAWQVALRPVEGADGRRDVYLDREQRRALIGAAADDLAVFLRGLSLLPLRPGALAALTVGAFDGRRGTLTVSTDKAGAGRALLLPSGTVEFLRECARGKLPGAPLFTRADGKAWDKDAWKKPMRAACEAAGLPDGAVAYSLRHSTITDLVSGGLDLATVATLAGTSVPMIQKHYAHLQGERAAAALERLAL